MPNSLYITNSQVNSGNPVLVNVNSINTDVECFSNIEETPKTSLSNISYTNFLSKGRNTGFSNPEHTIKGLYDLNDSHVTGTGGVFDYEYALEFVKRSDIVLGLSCDKWKTSDNPTGIIYCLLLSYSDSNTNSNIVTFTLRVKEVYV